MYLIQFLILLYLRGFVKKKQFQINNPRGKSHWSLVLESSWSCRAEPGTGSCAAVGLSNIILSSPHQPFCHFCQNKRDIIRQCKSVTVINSQVPVFRVFCWGSPLPWKLIRIQILSLHQSLLFHQLLSRTTLLSFSLERSTQVKEQNKKKNPQ